MEGKESVDGYSFIADEPAQLEAIAKEILSLFPDEKVFALKGDLGAGKTAFVKAFCSYLGVDEEISSPTFSIVHEYGTPAKVYHFDLYRLEQESDLYQIGFEEYFRSNAYVLIEWPELAEGLLPLPYVEIRFELVNKNRRNILCRKINNL